MPSAWDNVFIILDNKNACPLLFRKLLSLYYKSLYKQTHPFLASESHSLNCFLVKHSLKKNSPE